MNVLLLRFKEVIFSILPIDVLVLVLHFTIAPLESLVVWRFLIGSAVLAIGLTLFLIGVDIGITPLGDMTGVILAKTNKLWIIIASGIILGFFISVAEPGLMVLSSQVSTVTGGEISRYVILISVSVGLSLMLAFGFMTIVYNIPLYKVLFVLYAIILIISFFASKEFLAIAFDASGSTTGILAVPFILSLSVGISKLKKDSKAAEKDSFGLVAIASTGAVIAVLVLDIFSGKKAFSPFISEETAYGGFVLEPFIRLLPIYLYESFMAIIPLLLILILLQPKIYKLSKKEFRKLITGFVFAFTGLVIFLTGVNAGFMELGTNIGNKLVLYENKTYVIAVGFILGLLTILAEPAVYVLTRQIEEVTAGYINRKIILVFLALGVGMAVSLSVIRILIPSVQLWHYLLPGYIICIALMFVTPKLFVGIAFDAGGVATGPMTATFILAFIQGAAQAHEAADLMVDGFGMIAMVAMLPILALEILGLIFLLKSKSRTDKENEDNVL